MEKNDKIDIKKIYGNSCILNTQDFIKQMELNQQIRFDNAKGRTKYNAIW